MVYTLGWIGLGLAALSLEGVALFNSRRGDTLSEHMWVFVGARPKRICTCTGMWTSDHRTNPDCPLHGLNPVITPKWTLRVARLIILFSLLWLTLHFLTGGWV